MVQEKILYPRFLDNQPCGDDLFEGQPHKTIAQKITNLLVTNKSCKVIGLDGGWGSGKSNLIKLVQKELEKNTETKNKYKFFVYDAWGFQTDYQRRSILETLTAYLVTDAKILSQSKWEGRLRKLLTRTRSSGSKTVKELSAISKVSSIIAILSPLLLMILAPLYGSWIIYVILSILFLIILFVTYRLQVSNMAKYGQSTSFQNVLSELYYSYLDFRGEENLDEALKYETIYEEEPSSKDFKNWVEDIDKDLAKTDIGLIIVFDNMDRLPKNRVQELWSAIHTLFADAKFTKIHIIIPFDREHIRTAFKDENINMQVCQVIEEEGNGTLEKKILPPISYGDDFINKTFNVVYRVSPPTMHNWKEYFKDLWKEAFGVDAVPDYAVIQIYDLLTDVHSPRKIIAFVNEFVMIKQLFVEENIPDKYIAIFILKKNAITNKPDLEILNPSYLGALDFLYKSDPDLPKYISALYYQLPVEKALDLIYTDQLKRALDNADTEKIKQIQVLDSFYNLLGNAVVAITNIPNTTIALNECLTENNRSEQETWNCVLKSLKEKNEETFQKYQGILLTKVANKELYLKNIILGLYAQKDFNPIDFYKSINQLKEIDGVNPMNYLDDRLVDCQQFLKYVVTTKDNYKVYKIRCDAKKLDEFLGNADIEIIKNVSGIKYIADDYDLSQYNDNLKSLIDKYPNEQAVVSILFEHLKELERPVKKKLNDQDIYSLFTTTAENTPFYIDIICMAIEKLRYFPYIQSFNTVFQKTDDDFVDKVASQIEYYVCYGDLLLNASSINYPLYKEVVKKLTKTSYGISKLDIGGVLKSYETIINCFNIESTVLIKRLGGWNEHAKKVITIKNINSIPIKFFEDAIGLNYALTEYCVRIAREYLVEIQIESWKSSIIKRDYNYQLVIILQEDTQSCFDAFKEIIEEHSQNRIVSFTKGTYEELMSLFGKRRFAIIFKRIRDLFCTGKALMDSDLFKFYGKELMKYAELSTAPDSLRTILIPSLLDDNEIVKLLLEYKSFIVDVIKNTPIDEARDFKDKLISIYPQYKDNELFMQLLANIGIEMEEEKTSESQTSK